MENGANRRTNEQTNEGTGVNPLDLPSGDPAILDYQEFGQPL